MPALPTQGDLPPLESVEVPAEPIDDDVESPLTRLEIRDLSSEGAKRFLRSVDVSTILDYAVKTVHKILTPKRQGTPNVRSITLILRDFLGVAYTTGKDIDFEHKEIHFSTGYIEDIKPELLTNEITGVLVHEMVHVWQWNGQHTCNGGLIEGVADWVRLKAVLGPPHWRKRSKDCEWDGGYDVTAYFLEWLEEEFGEDVVVRLNQRLREKYVEEKFWTELCDGQDVKLLWARYVSALGEEGDEKECQEGENEEVKKSLPTEQVNDTGETQVGLSKKPNELNGDRDGQVTDI